MVGGIPITLVHWTPSWRLVSSVFPPTSLFDRVSSSEEMDAVLAIEGITNDRLRDATGDLSLIPEGERQFGQGTTPIMASFTHRSPDGSRFTNGSYGVYYAANSINTALAETRYHRERFLQRTDESPTEIDMRLYSSNINAELHDIRNMQLSLADVYDDKVYGASQQFALNLRNNQANGIVYDSVRHSEGQCIALFRANIPDPVTQCGHYCFVWNGSKIVETYKKSLL